MLYQTLNDLIYKEIKVFNFNVFRDYLYTCSYVLLHEHKNAPFY